MYSHLSSYSSTFTRHPRVSCRSRYIPRPELLRVTSAALTITNPWASLKDFFDHHSLVVLRIPCPIDEGQLAVLGLADEFVQKIRLLGQFLTIPPAEAFPFRRVVAEPRAQRRTWSKLREPSINPHLLLAYPARPHAVHQHARAVAGSRRIIRALQRDDQLPSALAFCGRSPGAMPLRPLVRSRPHGRRLSPP